MHSLKFLVESSEVPHSRSRRRRGSRLTPHDLNIVHQYKYAVSMRTLAMYERPSRYDWQDDESRVG